MSVNVDQLSNSENYPGATEYLNDQLIDEMWHKLDGQVSRENIRQAATEALTEFGSATVTTFIPIFIRRRIEQKLKGLMNGLDS